MKIKIIAFNKMGQEYKDLYNFYIQKLKRHCSLDIIEIQEFSDSDIKKNMIKNEEILQAKINDLKNFELILLEILGKQVDTLQFSNLIYENLNYNPKDICFIIGPSDGFSSEFKSKFNKKVSFSKLTFTYQMTRIILLEQIYRSFKIIKNEKYHK